jgi:hypothetical protein
VKLQLLGFALGRRKIFDSSFTSCCLRNADSCTDSRSVASPRLTTPRRLDEA